MCVDREMAEQIKGPCVPHAGNKCFRMATCRMKKDGECSFTHNKKSIQCLNSNKWCLKGGCGGKMCAHIVPKKSILCAIKPRNVCFKDAKCEFKIDGTCGWEEKIKLDICLKNFKKGTTNNGQ